MRFGEMKYAAMGKAYPWKEIPTIDDDRIEGFKKLVEYHGIVVDVGR